jgi:hypothetical protein
MAIDKDFIDSLLKPLGYVSREDCFGTICIVVIFKQIATVYFADAFMYITSYELLYKYLTTREFLVRDDNYVHMHNPYYGCKSLEEAIVRKDLIA